MKKKKEGILIFQSLPFIALFLKDVYSYNGMILLDNCFQKKKNYWKYFQKKKVRLSDRY